MPEHRRVLGPGYCNPDADGFGMHARGRFCSVSTGNPQGWLDPLEPMQAANAVALMKLQYAVLTSVDRDDLADGGAAHYAACIKAIRRRSPQTALEALTPDFAGKLDAVATVLNAGLATYAQNLETVERLTHPARDPRAGYAQTLSVLAFARRHAPDTLTKSSLMLGLGESDAEIARTLDDLRSANVDVVTLGQYMRPSPEPTSPAGTAIRRARTARPWTLFGSLAMDHPMYPHATPELARKRRELAPEPLQGVQGIQCGRVRRKSTARRHQAADCSGGGACHAMPLLHQGTDQRGAEARYQRGTDHGGDLGGRRDACRRRLRALYVGAGHHAARTRR